MSLNLKDKLNYKSNIWKLNLFMFLRGFQLFASILVPFYMDWGGISYFQISILQAVFVIFVFLFEIPSGAIADYFGRKYTLAFSAFFQALGIFIYAIYPSFYLFLIAEIIWGFGISLFTGANDALLYDSLKKINQEQKSKKYLGRFRSFDVLAIGLAALFGSYIASVIGLREVMFFSTIGPFIAFIVAFTLFEPKIICKKESYFKIIKEGINYFFNHKIIKFLIIDQISSIIFVMFMFIGYQFVFKEMGLDIKYFGFIHAGMVASQFIVLNSFDKIGSFFKNKRDMLFFMGFILAISYLGMSLSNSIILSIIFLIIAQGFGFPRDVMFSNYHNKFIPSNKRATVLSVISMFKSFVFAIFYPIAGYFFEYNFKITLMIFALFIFIFLIFSRVKEEHLID